MPIVINIPRNYIFDETAFNRRIAQDIGHELNIAWIGICDPDEPQQMTAPSFLDRFPNMRISFWDLKQSREYRGETIHPPSLEDAKKIVAFIKANVGKDICCNCAAGVSRSGAVAQFCDDNMGYQWPQSFRDLAWPNTKLLSLLREAAQ